MSEDKTKMQRAVEIVNFDNTGKVLKAEKDMIDNFIKNRKPVLNREGKDHMAARLNDLQYGLGIVLSHLDGRIKELEKLNKTEE